jgi:hypothetical protein
LKAHPPSATAASAGTLRLANAAAPYPRIAPFAPSFGPAILLPSHAPASFPIIFKLLCTDVRIQRAAGGECSEPKHGEIRQILVGEISHFTAGQHILRSFPGLARSLINLGHRPSNRSTGPKGRLKMQSQFTRTLVAIAAALAMSTVVVGAAVGPAQAGGLNPISVKTYA